MNPACLVGTAEPALAKASLHELVGDEALGSRRGHDPEGIAVVGNALPFLVDGDFDPSGAISDAQVPPAAGGK